MKDFTLVGCTRGPKWPSVPSRSVHSHALGAAAAMEIVNAD